MNKLSNIESFGLKKNKDIYKYAKNVLRIRIKLIRNNLHHNFLFYFLFLFYYEVFTSQILSYSISLKYSEYRICS